PVSEQRSVSVVFSVDENAECGSPIGITMQAAVYESGFNQVNNTLFSRELGNNGACSIVNYCSPDGGNSIQPTNGLWYNINRSGNGNDMYFLNSGLVYVQYTALEDRSPIWYITGANGYYQNNQAYNDLNKHEYNGPFLNSTRTITQVGESHTTIVDANTAIQTRTINGKFSADLMQSFIFSNDATPKQRTGLWYNESKPGWGLTVGTQGDTEVVVSYLFDDNGQPYWVLGSDQSNAEVKDIPMSYFKAFCPHCPTVPLEIDAVGSVRMDYDEPTALKHTATLENLNISHPNNSDLIWQRNDIPFTLLTPQQD
ncbi:MAG: hypothetical protein L3J83_12535, partial [Proteobacteria bacterium]|nr:hypothetical protein [Pseudomonadota bacterium]